MSGRRHIEIPSQELKLIRLENLGARMPWRNTLILVEGEGAMTRRTDSLVVTCLLLPIASAMGQKAPKPLTNDDVLAMVQKKMPESVVV